MKTKSESKYFWTRIEEGLHEKGITLAELCRQQEINYDSIISSKMRGTYPGTITTFKIAQALGMSMEVLIAGNQENLYVAEDTPSYGTDPLYQLLSGDADLKGLVWRIVQCSAAQLRAIKTMLQTWDIGPYDSMGKPIKQTV